MLNVYNPDDIVHHVPSMGSPEFMRDVQSAFKAVLAHVNRTKYGSDLGAFGESSKPKRYADEQDTPECTQLDDLDDQDYAEADKQRDAEETELKKQAMDRLVYDMYINSLS